MANHTQLGICLILTAALFQSTCKDSEGSKVVISDDTPSIEVEKAASATREVRASESFFYSIWKVQLEKNYAKTVATRSGTAARIPYSGYWYPEKRTNYNGTQYNANAKGGTHIGSPSPLEKYDNAFNGGQNKAVEWEIKNHTRAPSDPDSGWAGHCNGFSSAAQRHEEPKNPVTENGETFSPLEIKALLAEIHMSAKFYIIGGNRCDNLEIENKPTTRDQRADPEIMGECEDVNPASFHLAVTNWIGRQKHALIMDRQLSEQVWNYPVYSYSIESSEDNLTLAQVRQNYLSGSSTTYEYNPLATSFAYVKMQVTYSDAFSTGERLGQQTPVSKVYEYILEKNQADEVIGGEWIRSSVTNHPDFIWVALEPVLGSGDKLGANPYVKPEDVISLWARSIGADPKNPPLDIVEPIWQNNWGRFANYELEIDGDQTGAVFLGKEANLKIVRKATLEGDIQLLLTLDDTVLRRVDLQGKTPVDLNFSPKPGVHRLGLQWKKSDQVVDSRYVRIHVIH